MSVMASHYTLTGTDQAMMYLILQAVFFFKALADHPSHDNLGELCTTIVR